MNGGIDFIASNTFEVMCELLSFPEGFIKILPSRQILYTLFKIKIMLGIFRTSEVTFRRLSTGYLKLILLGTTTDYWD